MLPMAHRILSQPAGVVPDFIEEAGFGQGEHANYAACREFLSSGGTVVVVNEVVSGYFANDEIPEDCLGSDGLCGIRVPWQHRGSGAVFMEANAPRFLGQRLEQLGWFVRESIASDGSVAVQVSLFISLRGVVCVMGYHASVLVDDLGNPVGEPIGDHRGGVVKGQCPVLMNRPAWLSLQLANCRNIGTKEAVGVGPTPKWLRRQKLPEIKYHVLTISQGVARADSEAGDATELMALHVCRGHFANYTQERPLFGKYAGRFWIPQHVKGRAKNGVVVKDYEVKV